MDHVRIAAPHTFRRFALQIALGLALAESGLFFFVWRLGVLVEPAADRQPALAFILLGSVLTLQAMVVVGIAWAVVALVRGETVNAVYLALHARSLKDLLACVQEIPIRGLSITMPYKQEILDGVWRQLRRAPSLSITPSSTCP